MPFLTRIRFSLRAMLLALLVFSSAFAWVGSKIHRGRRQRAAREYLSARKWAVLPIMLSEHDPTTKSKAHTIEAPRWMRDLVGDDVFDDIVWVKSPDKGTITSKECDYLMQLTGVRHLKMNHGATDEVLVRSSTLANIEWLEATYCKVSNGGLKNLKDMPRLKYLILTGTQITDDGLPFLGAVHTLEYMDLSRTNIDGSGLAHLRGLSQLTILALCYTNVTGNGLQELKYLGNLKTLELTGCPIDDSAIPYLCELSQLSSVSLSDTNMTLDGVNEIRQRLPRCDVLYFEFSVTDSRMAMIVGGLESGLLNGNRSED